MSLISVVMGSVLLRRCFGLKDVYRRWCGLNMVGSVDGRCCGMNVEDSQCCGIRTVDRRFSD